MNQPVVKPRGLSGVFLVSMQLKARLTERLGIAGCIFLLGVLSGMPAAAEEPTGPEAPEETDLLLPSALLEVEAVDPVELEAPLPDFADLSVPDLEMPLPETEELLIADDVFELPGDPARAEPPVTGEVSIYSSGRLGIGIRNHILGELALYRLGADPNFDIRFLHESIDGYGDEPAGTGFFSRRDEIGGSLEFGAGPLNLAFDGSFVEEEDGLQGLAPFYSVNQRHIDGGADVEWQPDADATIRLDTGAASAERRFVSGEEGPEEATELGFDARLAGELAFETWRAGLRGDYALDMPPEGGEWRHRLSATTFAEVDIGTDLALDGSVGIGWGPDRDIAVPFELGVSGTIDDVLSLGLAGGMRLQPPRYRDLWREVPAAEASETYPEDSEKWFTETSVNWLVTPEVTLDGGIEFLYSSNAVDVEGFGEESGKHPLFTRELTTLAPRLEVAWNPVPYVRAVTGWDARLIERRSIDPAHRVFTELEAGLLDDRIGGSLQADFPVFEEPVLPRMHLGAYGRLAEGVELRVDLEDLLAPALEHGRARYGAQPDSAFPFVEPGLRATFSAHLSL